MWSLYSTNFDKEEYLKPLTFSNGKTQEDVVKEIIDAIKEGYKVIFIKGVCGTGKSAIALNLAKEMGRASIVVPVKNLQKQYEDDYTSKKYLLKNGQKLKMRVMTGRANHLCPFLKERADESRVEKEEKNSVLVDFEDGKSYSSKKDDSCDCSQLPCKIEIKEKNIKKIREYLKENPRVELGEFANIHKVRRMSISPICPYWSPIVPSEIDLDLDADCRDYLGLNNKKFTIYQRKPGCGYYDQFKAYLDADVLIFNSLKYQLETVMDRKPATDVEIIDECDEFLDSFSNDEKINFNRLNFALGMLFPKDEKTNRIIDKLINLSKEGLKDKKIEEHVLNDEIIPLTNTKILDLLRCFLDSDLMECVECDEENYCYHVDKVARMFKDFFKETYVSFYKEEKDLIARVVTTNLEKRFKELLDKNRVIVMMSGTIHSKEVLKNIFGLSEFKIIEAETNLPGKITKKKTGLEINCRYSNFQKGDVTREEYLLSLAECIKQAEKPVLVHVNAFKDIPSEQEAEKYNLNIITRENLRELQKEDNAGGQVKKFKQKEIDILYSTTCNRGVDFPGSICNSIILTKYPYPNVSSPFWRILKRTKPFYYNSFYMDKASREFLQRIYRGLRSNEDHIYLLSPDSRVFDLI